MNPIQSFTSALEKNLHSSSLFFKLYSLPYTKVVEREIRLADITSDDTVLNVGCGSLPFTSVKLAEMTGAKIYALDIDEKAISAAQSLVDTLNLEETIDFIVADGTDTISIDFDKAVVALQVRPQGKTVKNLFSCSDNDVSVIVRIPREKFRNTYGPIPDLNKAEKSVKHHMLTFDRSILLKNG